jgi:hypothetical protein
MWNHSHADFPADGSPRQRLGFALQYASLAPTTIKLRPWELRLADTHLELLANDNPALEAIDQDGRESMIGCGAALLYLKLALKHFGRLGRVALFPNLNQPRIVARIHTGFCGERDAQERLLFEAMTRRGSNPLLMGGTPISETMLASLSQAAEGERGRLDFVQSETSRRRVMEITLVSDQRWPNLLYSLARPRNTAVRRTLRWPRALFGFGGRNPVSQNLTIGPVRDRSIPAMTLAVVKTKTDDKHGWLAAGETMARVVLQATALGLSWGFFNQVRHRGAREALRMGIGHKGFAQVILRFGSLTTEPARRALQTTATANASI